MSRPDPADYLELARRLAESFTRKCTHPDEAEEDAYSAACEALCAAARDWDGRVGFRRYAGIRIWHSMIDDLRARTGFDRIGAYAAKRLTEEHARTGADPLSTRCAELANVSPDAQKRARPTLTPEPRKVSLFDGCDPEVQGGQPEVDTRELVEVLLRTANLTELERELVREYFFAERTYVEIGARRGMREYSVGRMVRLALIKLKERADELDYL